MSAVNVDVQKLIDKTGGKDSSVYLCSGSLDLFPCTPLNPLGIFIAALEVFKANVNGSTDL